MALGNLKVTLNLVADQYMAGIKEAQREATTFANKFKPLGQTLQDFGSSLRNVGLGMTAAVTAPLVAAGGLVVKTGIDFESAFAGVRKTVQATEPELESIRQQFRDMAKEIPVSAVEIAKIGEAAGQLGIQTKDIAAFTKQMAMLGATTNLTSDQAATATAQFQNIFGAAGKEVDRFASALVGLGNAGASTEKDIIEMGVRIAGAGNLVGLTQAQVLGFASALSSVGINAEAGGSAISRVFLKMGDAVAKGGAGLAQFAAIAGMTANSFRDMFKADPAEATLRFVEGLQKLKTAGVNVNGVLESVVGKNIILKDTLMRAAGAGGELRRQVELGTEEWQKNTAAQEEFGKRVQTTESQLKILKNQLIDIGIELFDALKPIIQETVIPGLKKLAGIVAELAEQFNKLPRPVQTAVVGILGFVALVGPALAGLGFAIQGLGLAIGPLAKITSLLSGSGAAAKAASAGYAAAGINIASMGTGAAKSAGLLSTLGASASGLAGTFGKLLPMVTTLSPAVALLGIAFADLYISKKAADMLGFTDAIKQSWPEVQRLGANLRVLGGELVGIVQTMVLQRLEQLKNLFVQIGSIVPLLGQQIAKLGGIFEYIARPIDTFKAKVLADIYIGMEALKKFNDFLERRGPTRPAAVGMGNLKESEGRAAVAVKPPQALTAPSGAPIKLPPIVDDKSAKELERFNEAVLTLKQSLTDTTPPSKELVAAIYQLHNTGQMSSKVLLALGKDVDTLKNSKDPLIQQYARMIPLIQLASRSFEMEAEQLQLVAEAAKNRPEFDPKLLEPLVDLSGPDLKPLTREEFRQSALQKRVDEANQSLDAQRNEVEELSEAIRIMIRDGKSAADIENALGVRIGDVAERARELGVELDATTRKVMTQADQAETLRRAWGESFARISDGLVDMIVDFDFSFKRLKDIGLDTAKSMARSFLDGFFKPFKDGLNNLGQQVGSWAAGLVFGKTGGQGQQQQSQGLLGGLLGNVGGGLLGQIFGGGGQGQQGGLLGRIFGTPPFNPNAGMPGLGGLSQMTGLAGTMNPIGMGVSIANQAFDLGVKITDKIGKGRDSANEVIKSQEAFVNQTLKGILADADLSATNKLKLVMNEWETFQQALARYAAGGGENPVTANQAFATVSPLVANIQRDLLKAGANISGSDSGGDNTFNITINAPGAVAADIDRLMRDSIIPAINEAMIHNTQGLGEHTTRTVIKMTPAIVST